ncbi:MAG: DUF4235 domain-containing protein [Propionibacteriaceae bacterium]
MRPSQKLLWQIYTGIIGTATTVATQKLVTTGWKAATGAEPPAANDPQTPLAEAATWALASGVGIGMIQLVTNRYMARRWHGEFQGKAPSTRKVSVKI